MNLQTQGRLTTPQQFGAIVLRANPDGSALRIRDVARVEIGAQNEDSESRLNGKPAVAIGLYLSPGANAVQTAAAVKTRMDRLKQRFPEGLNYTVVYDTTTFINDTIREVLQDACRSLRPRGDRRVSFPRQPAGHDHSRHCRPREPHRRPSPCFSIGYSANTISLLALVLAIGIVVDDAIVVVENVERVMEEEPDLSPADATKKAMSQITAPIIAITLVLLSIFVPNRVPARHHGGSFFASSR